ncbi:MAG: hypothetical protein AB7I25_08680 [Vicinamibacterales bacterium]
MNTIGDALRQDLEAVAAGASVPPASAVWFRAERRARQDALRRAEQPIWLAERLALVGAGVVLGWLSSLALPWLRSEDLPGRATALVQSLTTAPDAVPVAGLVVFALCAVAVSFGMLAAFRHD